MANPHYPAKKEIVDRVRDLILSKPSHHDLVPVIDQIAVMFCEKAPKQEGVGIPFQVKKAPTVLDGLPEIKVRYAFFIILSAEMWADANSMDQESWLFSALCACSAEEDEDSGETKTKTRKPDVWGYRDAVDEYGLRALFPQVQPDQNPANGNDIVSLLQNNGASMTVTTTNADGEEVSATVGASQEEAATA